MSKFKAFLQKLQFWKRKDRKEKASGEDEQVDEKPKLKKATRIILVCLVWIFIMMPWFVFWMALRSAERDGLPSTRELENPKSNEASEVYTSDGELAGKYFAENRTPVTYNELSPHLVDALVATEDERFFEHAGVDVWALPRVAMGLVQGDQSSGGGSTISQQLAKMLFSERDFSNMGKFEKMRALINVKLKEWILATELERKFTKKEIITMYFNKFDFLNNAVGVHSAAKVYFNTTPDSLKIEQAATLVGMAKNPSIFNPRRNSDTTKHRRNVVLKQWLKNSVEDNPALHYKLSQAEYDSLKELPLVLDYQKVDHQDGIAPYFREILREAVVDTLANMYASDYKQMERVLSKAEYDEFLDSMNIIMTSDLTLVDRHFAKKDLFKRWAKYMLYNKGLRIYTTIDSRMQSYAEWAIKEWLSTELQAQLEKQQKKRLKDEWPFDLKGDFYKKEDRDSVINFLIYQGMRRSDRWYGMEQQGYGKVQIEKEFDKPVPMKVFSWEGEIDTVMSPRDSVRYYKQFLQAGMMSMDPKTGYVKAWVGGTDFYHFKFDHVIKSRRQVGSTFKPFVYATAIDMGAITPCYEAPNIEYCCDIAYNKYRNKQWCPKGGMKYDGVMTSMKFGLASSLNNITAHVMCIMKNGPQQVVKRVEAMGIEEGYLQPVPALALGIADLSVYEMVGAQATFVNKGVYIRPIIISRIEDKLGNVIYDADPQMTEVFGEEVAYLTLQLMKGVMDGARRSDGKTGGTAAGLRYYHEKSRPWGGIRQPMAGKTGTTQNGSDGWFIGLTPDLVTGVWVGAEDRSVHFPNITWGQGGRMALPIYGYYMQKVYADEALKISQEDFEKPSQPIPDELWNCRLTEDGGDGPIDYGDPDDMDFNFENMLEESDSTETFFDGM